MPSKKKLLKQKEKQEEVKNAKLREQYVKEGRPVPYHLLPKASFSKSTSATPFSLKTTTQGQENVLDRLSNNLPQGIQNLSLPGSPSSFGPIGQEALRNHTQNSIPSLAQRFTGLDALGSSGFRQALNASQGDFESQIASLQAQHGLAEQGQQSSNLFNSLNSYLSPQFASGINPGQDSSLRQGWNAVSNLAGNNIGKIYGGVSSLFGGNNQQPAQQQQQQQAPMQYNGTGAGQNSFGFGQSQQNQLSTQNVAQSGYPDLSGLQTNNNSLSPANPQGYNNMILNGYQNNLR